jgi:hypothetical protein
MSRFCVWGLCAIALHAAALGQEPPVSQTLSPADKQQIEAAHQLTTEAAGKYSFTLAGSESSAMLVRDPVLRWSNPAAGEIHGNVFIWTVDDRPAVVGSLFKWFSPHTHMSHEFHSLAEHPLAARYEQRNVWTTSQPGLKFNLLAGAPQPATSAPQRLLQMKRLVKDFAATKHERDGSRQELRLLTQPIYRYAALRQDVLDGAVFVLVQGTDPEVFVLLEARGESGKQAWTFAATRMNSVGFQLRYQDKEVWSVEVMPWSDVGSHAQTYTTFMFKMP